MLMATALMAQAGLQIASGLYSATTASAKASAQRKILTARYDYNVKQLDKAFATSYDSLMANYAVSRDNYIKSATTSIGDTNTQISANASNVNLANSSFKGDINAQMDKQLIDNVNVMLLNQQRDTESLINQNANAKIQARSSFVDVGTSINNTENQSKMMGYAQMIGGSFNFATSYGQYKYDTSDDNVSESLTNFSFGGGN